MRRYESGQLGNSSCQMLRKFFFKPMVVYMSKLDLSMAYEQIPLHPESRYISRFRSPFGMFQYCRLFLGPKSASEKFHEIIRCLLVGIEGVQNIQDDIFIHGKTVSEHNERFELVCKSLEDAGLTVNIKKCKILRRKLNFFGLTFEQGGVSLSDQKTKALREYKIPDNKCELHSFLGLSTYVSKWLPNLATIADPLWFLTKNDVRWHWDESEQESFDKIKQALVSNIAYFRLDWKTQVTVDASPVGLGIVLTQYDPNNPSDRQIVMYISRSLSRCERKYSQIEKEALAVVWALERLELYVLGGSEFELFCDNKAVTLIISNPLSKPPARIQRWELRLSPFNFKIIHIPGAGNIADFLSRHPLAALVCDGDGTEEYIDYIISGTIPLTVSRDDV